MKPTLMIDVSLRGVEVFIFKEEAYEALAYRYATALVYL